ncbi:ribonuclease III [Candidatus Curtissbacteria bacterium RIFCSPHIGHO2_12_FULL_38_9b]|uniref:Ribonuclease 3 n=2 Tax=Candidatus Curtissiibacteriota TaxID=1752717 RepID=A0A1F5GXV2_9BACT|nr:MAG: ribonuclease III [Candidatus Curtissbacteria bacterium RIFCSPLOWO2_01_FULL_37_9]OGD96752.1 MAG: ribonuclease III [Candidatus Curtissbacteria bacterium RIFCSPHIGHO2_12_FULL_38_9b]
MIISKSQTDWTKLQQTIGIKFINIDLLNNAFVHRSYLNEHKNYKGNSNERLEFLGDSVLSLVVSIYLYKRLPKSTEGELTMLRASLVRTETLSKLALSLNLGTYLYLSKGEEESNGRNSRSILANTFEALIGAIYLDQGLLKTQKVLEKLILKKWETLTKTAVFDNKSKLQEVLQRKYHKSPNYKLLTSWGPDHAREFRIGVYLDTKLLGKGIGKNKQEAAQNAAKEALSGLKT